MFIWILHINNHSNVHMNFPYKWAFKCSYEFLSCGASSINALMCVPDFVCILCHGFFAWWLANASFWRCLLVPDWLGNCTSYVRLPVFSTTCLNSTVKGSAPAPRLLRTQLYSPVYSTGVHDHIAAPDTAPEL